MQHQKLFIIGLFLIATFTNCEKSCDEVENCQELEHDGLVRNYWLHVPDSLAKNPALVFVLHGYTGTPQNLMKHSKFNNLANKYGFVVCYPKGIKDKYRNLHWDADLEISETDDVGFLTNLAKALQEKYEVIGDVRGSGLIFGAEMVLDRDSKTPASDLTDRIINEMRQRGVIHSKLGRHKNTLKIRPPMPFTTENADLLFDTLDEVLAETPMSL